jgi:hypothetical protein
MNSTITAHGECCTQCFGALLGSNRHGHYFLCTLGFLETYSFLYGNLTKGIERHFNVGKIHGIVLDANFNGIIHDALDSNEYLHYGI